MRTSAAIMQQEPAVIPHLFTCHSANEPYASQDTFGTFTEHLEEFVEG